MHSGYPIVTHMDVAVPTGESFLLNGSVAKVGHWGPFHEIGHNMQRDEWTFKGTGEVTVNIFTLYAMDKICHLQPWIHPKLQEQLSELGTFLKDAADFEKFGDFGIFMYAQLQHEFGWKSFKTVFRRYESMIDEEKPKDEQMKIDTWFSIFSEAVKLNLSPLASFWGIPLSKGTIDRLQTAFPVGFLPDDEVTRLAPDRVDAALRQFPESVRKWRGLE